MNVGTSNEANDANFRSLMVLVTQWFDRYISINMLQVLYRDHIENTFALRKSSNSMELMSMLIGCGHLGPNNLTLLYDTIMATKQFGLEQEIKNQMPLFKIPENNITTFTPHRQRIVKLGLALTEIDVQTICVLYDVIHTDSWRLIMDLEHKMDICEDNMEEFINKLKEHKLRKAVKALTEVDITLRLKRKRKRSSCERTPLDNTLELSENIQELTRVFHGISNHLKKLELDIAKIAEGSIIFHLSVYDPYALMNLWEIHSSGELIKDLAKFVPLHLQDEFIKEWRTVVDKEEYESAIRRLKDRVQYDSFIAIISDDTEFENQLKVDLQNKRPDLKFSIIKHWRLSKPEAINHLIAKSSKVIIAFSPRPLTDYFKYAAHSVVIEMLEAKTLDDAKIIPVKISEDAVVPSEFKLFNVVNACKEHFVDKLLQELDECDSLKMATLTGMLLDVSGSVAENAGEINQGEEERVNLIFQVVDNLIKHNSSCKNEVFAVGVGAMGGSGIFDLLRTIEHFKDVSDHSNVSYDIILDGMYSILERNGARQIRKWAQSDTIKSVVSHEMASAVLDNLQSERGFAKKVVQDCLPAICRDWTDHGLSIRAVAQWAYTSVVTFYRQATKTEIEEVQDKIILLMMKGVESESILSAKKASTIIHGCIDDQKQLDARRINELKEIVRPFIYGHQRPLFEALRKVTSLFPHANYKKKLLFILSDGMPTDQGNSVMIQELLNEAGVTVVGCYITRSRNINPRHLYSKSDVQWDDGARFLFSLSSTIKKQSLPRKILMKQDWKVDSKSNETRLFQQVNIRERCDLVRNVVCSQDALSDMLTWISQNIYISKTITGLRAPTQVGGTSYANASAAVVHLSLKRILGRHGGYPEFHTLRQEMIDLYGPHGAVTYEVLKRICPKYRLHCKNVDVVGAMKAITEKRPVVATFDLTDPEWNIFGEFYKNNPTGIISKNELDIRKRRINEKFGRAVVLTSFNSECLYLMNSWGVEWADMGFFRVQSADVLDLKFIDVYWTEEDLLDSEKLYYKKHGAQVASDLISSLQGLQQAEYTCPLCDTESFVVEFRGTLSNATCPSCEGSFSCGESGNILAMNIHLLSLTR